MNDHWQRTKDLLADALERPAAERTAFVAGQCDDVQLRAEVLAMVAAAEAADQFLETGPTLPTSVQPLAKGTILGAYAVEALIGEGGFSEVYRCRQDQPFVRLVAIKLLKPGMDSRAVLARFQAERQTLARMSHPHIARVLDAGALPNGRPFVVMELVAGRPLPRYAEDAGLGTAARLALFLQVCDAVAHAHRRGVIHRDLKPSNVLVELRDDVASAKVIDFGIAKLLDPAEQPDDRTAPGIVLGTPGYASPEQLAVGGDDIDTRTDVFALGVLLGELVDGDPSTPPPKELRWIAAKAQAADRDQRYAGVDPLVADVRRFLAGEAIAAGPPSVTYRLAKFARRHRLLLASSALAAMALLVGGIVATVGYYRAEDARVDAEVARGRAEILAADESKARAAAEAALQEAEAVGDFLGRLLAAARPDRKGREVRVTDLLGASEAMFARMAGFPDASARLRRIVGDSYSRLGDYAAAHGHLREALQSYEQRYGPDDWRRIDCLFAIVALLIREGRLAEAEPLRQEVAARALATRGENHPLARQLLDLEAKSAFERGDYPAGAAVLRRLLALDEADGREEAVIATLGNLAQILLRDNQREEARALAQRGYDLAVARRGATHPLTLTAGRKLAAVHINAGDHAALVAAVEPLVEAARTRLGADHPDTLGLVNYLALGYQKTGRPELAEPLYRELLAAHEGAGKQHPQAIMALHNLGLLLEARGSFAEAEPLLRDAVARFLALRGPDHLDTRNAQFHLARTVAALGRHEEIAASFAEAAEALQFLHGRGSEKARSIRRTWTEHLLLLGTTAALEAAFQSFGELGDVSGQQRAAAALAVAFDASGDPEAAAKWRAAAR